MKLRSVNTGFWSDPFIEELTSQEKLLYLYLITNEKTNMIGIYEVSFRRISYDTGIKKEAIENALKRFEKLKKVYYKDNHIVLVNFLNHQNFNTNMKKSAIDCYNDLPDSLKVQDVKASKENPLEGFERIRKGYGMVSKEEDEGKDKDEGEGESEDELNTQKHLRAAEKKKKLEAFDFWWDAYSKKVDRKKCLEKFMVLSIDEMRQCYEHTKQYVRAYPDAQFRRNPETYLNNENWKEEHLTIKRNGNEKESIHSKAQKFRDLANQL